MTNEPTPADLARAERTAYALGELPAADAARVAASIANDPAAQAEVAAIRQLATGLAQAFAHEPQPGLDARRKAEALRAAISPAPAASPKPIPFVRRPVLLVTTLGSLAAAAAVTVVVMQQTAPTPVTGPAVAMQAREPAANRRELATTPLATPLVLPDRQAELTDKDAEIVTSFAMKRAVEKTEADGIVPESRGREEVVAASEMSDKRAFMRVGAGGGSTDTVGSQNESAKKGVQPAARAQAQAPATSTPPLPAAAAPVQTPGPRLDASYYAPAAPLRLSNGPGPSIPPSGAAAAPAPAQGQGVGWSYADEASVAPTKPPANVPTKPSRSKTSLSKADDTDTDGKRRLEAQDHLANKASPGGVPADWWRSGQTGAPVVSAPAGGESYRSHADNPFVLATDQPLSTFGMDVDTASYATVRRFLQQDGRLPPPEAVRLEELINSFRYELPKPSAQDGPLGLRTDYGPCPWAQDHRLLRVTVASTALDPSERPALNLIFLIDVSGSMGSDNKLPLAKQALRLLAGQLSERDRIGIVTYAGEAGVALEPTADKAAVRAAIDRLGAGGSTNGAGGIRMAYDLARRGHRAGVQSRVVLCTDGDFNVGVSDPNALKAMITEEKQSGVFLTALGFGMGNYRDDTLGTLATAGNGNHAYIDTIDEARKHLVEGCTGTMVTVAKDVKIQIEFNPALVTGWRQLGYEKRQLAAQDFTDDRKDAGEVGAGQVVTALYEVVPAGSGGPVALRYAAPAEAAADDALRAKGRTDELGFVRLRWKAADADRSRELSRPIPPNASEAPTADLRFMAAVAGFGMLLRQSPYAGNLTWQDVLQWAQRGAQDSDDPQRRTFVELVRTAARLSGARLDR